MKNMNNAYLELNMHECRLCPECKSRYRHPACHSLGMVVVCNDCKTQEDMDEEYGDEE